MPTSPIVVDGPIEISLTVTVEADVSLAVTAEVDVSLQQQ